MNNKFSENLKKIRKDNNLSQEQLADELGVSRQAISKWESAAAYPEMDKIIFLCDKFNLNIDDLLHGDIREIKGEEQVKKKINNYIDDFLNFITDTINMFCKMKFKSKIKCLFEQAMIIFILLIIFGILAIIGSELFRTIFGFLNYDIYRFIYGIFQFIFMLFVLISSIIIMVHIFKTRYLNYYKNIKVEKEIIIEENSETIKAEKIEIKEDKIIIRDPKHSEYKFINGLFNIILFFIKLFVFEIAVIFSISLVGLFCLYIMSFLISKSGLVFIGLLIGIIGLGIINVDVLVVLLNFIFNRKNNKKLLIYSFISALIISGIGIGFIINGVLGFKYIEDDLEKKYYEIEMKDDLILEFTNNVEYIESDNSNIKIEYNINKFCDLRYSRHYYSETDNYLFFYGYCGNPLKVIDNIIDNLNNRKVVVIDEELYDVRIYTSRENIEKLKYNRNNLLS